MRKNVAYCIIQLGLNAPTENILLTAEVI